MMADNRYTREQLKKEIINVKEAVDKDYLSQTDFQKHSDISIYRIKKEFGSWRKAKQEVGLKTYKVKDFKPDKEKLYQQLKDAAEETEGGLNKTEFIEKTNDYTRSIFNRKILQNSDFPDKWADLCEDAGVKSSKRSVSKSKLEEKLKKLAEDYEYVYPLLISKEFDKKIAGSILKTSFDPSEHVENYFTNKEMDIIAAEKILSEFGYGFLSKYDMKQFLNKELGAYLYGGRRAFQNFVDAAEKLGFKVRDAKVGGKNNSIYIKDPSYENESKYREKMKEKWRDFKLKLQDSEGEKLGMEDELFDTFVQWVGKGYSPTNVFASLAYIKVESLKQPRISDIFEVSTVSIRRLYKKILEQSEDLEIKGDKKHRVKIDEE